jgi:hypothetical protein
VRVRERGADRHAHGQQLGILRRVLVRDLEVLDGLGEAPAAREEAPRPKRVIHEPWFIASASRRRCSAGLKSRSRSSSPPGARAPPRGAEGLEQLLVLRVGVFEPEGGLVAACETEPRLGILRIVAAARR